MPPRLARALLLTLSSVEHVQGLMFLYLVIEDHDVLFLLSEGCHVVGLAVLVFKLQQKGSAAGKAFCAPLDLPNWVL